MPEATVVTSDNKWGYLYTDTPDNLGSLCPGYNWGNQYTRAVQGQAAAMKNALTLVRL